MKALCLKHRGL